MPATSKQNQGILPVTPAKSESFFRNRPGKDGTRIVLLGATVSVVVASRNGGSDDASAMSHPVASGLAPAVPFSSPFPFQREARDDVLGFLTKWAELGGVVRFRFVARHELDHEMIVTRITQRSEPLAQFVRPAREGGHPD